MADLDLFSKAGKRHPRRGVTLLLACVLMVAMLGMVAFALDMGYIVLVRTQLQAAADSAAMAAAQSMGLSRDELVAVAQQYAAYHSAGGPDRKVQLLEQDVEYGIWDATERRFTPTDTPGNAVRVTARVDQAAGGEAALFFGRIFGRFSFAQRASAVAMANPRDIAFVVDLSGSMNDDTEPCWATPVINSTFAKEGYPTVGSELMEQLFADFGFGRFPGRMEYLGEPFGVRRDKWAYAELTKDGGPLSSSRVPERYRIRPSDNEATRKIKAYSALIDYQIARVMPNARPTPDSRVNYAYWEKYLDYLIIPVTIKASSGSNSGGGNNNSGGGSKGGNGSQGGSSSKSGPGNSSGGKGTSPPPAPKPPAPKPPLGYFEPDSPMPGLPGSVAWFASISSGPRAVDLPRLVLQNPDMQLAMAPGMLDALLVPQMLAGATPGTPPNNRGTLPPAQDSDRIGGFNNPNRQTFPQAKAPSGYQNWIGYVTYVQFMMDHGRDLRPVGSQYVPLSRYSRDCPWHAESTAGGTFSFPPREQPTHAARRALIAALQVVKERNQAIRNPTQRDWVSIIAYDTLSGGGPVLEQPLTADYDLAMQACTRLQAVGDKGPSTATEAGLLTARKHIASPDEGGQGRRSANKVVVLLTDGVPNLYVSDPAEISRYIAQSDSRDFYNNGAWWLDAPLMQAMQIQEAGWQLFPVGVGLGTDYNFMDRMARMGGTANDDGQSVRGSGNPAEYEQRLAEIFEKIITNPKVRLVQ